MLLTLMMNLDMFGPPTPTPSRAGGDTNLDSLMPSGGFTEHREHERKGRKKILEEDTESVIYEAIAFVLCQE